MILNFKLFEYYSLLYIYITIVIIQQIVIVNYFHFKLI